MITAIEEKYILEFFYLLAQAMQFPQFIPPPCQQCIVHTLLRFDTTLQGLVMRITKTPKQPCPTTAAHLSKALHMISFEKDDYLDLSGSRRAFSLRMGRYAAYKKGIPYHFLSGACSPYNHYTEYVRIQEQERLFSLSVHHKLDTQTCSGMRSHKNETPASPLLPATWMVCHYS